MAKASKKKVPGRPAGAMNAKHAFPRDENTAGFRCSRGYIEVAKEMVRLGLFKSKADVYHEAMQILAMRKLEAGFYWREKIQ